MEGQISKFLKEVFLTKGAIVSMRLIMLMQLIKCVPIQLHFLKKCL